MKICISGGTGFVGSSLAERLLERGDQLTLISSSGKSHLEDHPAVQIIAADTTSKGEWQNEIPGFDVIINLAGRTIFNYWNEAYKKQIYSSRVETTQNIVEALPQECETVLLSASAAGYYGASGDKEMVESDPAGDDFLAEVCKDWEAQACAAKNKGARVAVMRFGVVLGSKGGAIATMKTPFKLGLGGPIGSGKQWFPWIHIDDLIGGVIFLMDGNALSGAYNFTAPGTVRQKEFAKKLGQSLNRPTFMPAPSFIMKNVLGDFGKSLLTGQKAIPQHLQDSGFVFKYSQLEDALQEILHG